MRRFIGIAALMIVIALVGQSAMAQSFKFGHINSDELIQSMPEYDQPPLNSRNSAKNCQCLELMQVNGIIRAMHIKKRVKLLMIS